MHVPYALIAEEQSASMTRYVCVNCNCSGVVCVLCSGAVQLSALAVLHCACHSAKDVSHF